MLSARLNNMDCGLKTEGRTAGATVSASLKGELLPSIMVCLLRCWVPFGRDGGEGPGACGKGLRDSRTLLYAFSGLVFGEFGRLLYLVG